ncbi:MAG: peptide ABC transporter ATP-binding protein [Gemmatimonadetes bacterium]|nr:peptide ABC transporter ATP-binding protein [Gemmatimonadota bacterium]|tara:strand:+ start:901 stop:1932 length:1032 start_codon:yes stop_codon:yes gene_type:complete
MSESDGKADVLFEIEDLKTHFPIKKGIWRKVVGHVKAVDGVSMTLRRGETLGLVGESGCGKTTTGRSMIRLIEPTDGRVTFHHAGQAIDLRSLEADDLRGLRRYLQYIFQDPFSSLNPRMTVFDIVAEPLVINEISSGSELEGRVEQLLVRVGLRPDHLRRYPHAFSGGQRQRIGIARALALTPQLIIADEPVSALDVSVQAQVINLMEELQEEFDLTYLFVAHDLSVVEHISDRVAVMYLGQIVELTTSDRLYERPLHPYTVALMSAVPIADPDHQMDRVPLEGDVPDPADAPSGCKFHPRCAYAQDICKTDDPSLREIEPGHEASCHFAGEIDFETLKIEH